MDALKRRRASVKARLTTFKTYLTKLNDTIKDVEAPDDRTLIELEQRIQKAESIEVDFQEIQTQIEIAVPENLLDDEFAERELFTNNFFEVISLAKNVLNSHRFVETGDNGSIKSSERSQDASIANDSQNFIKLPTIQLPKFEGSYENWLEFRDTFESLIHKNASINNIQKFHYLRASLGGSAAQVIKSLEFTANNYMVAFDALCDRYDNNRLLIHNHVKALFNLESLTIESSSKVRKLIDTVNKHIRALTTLGQPTEHWDTIIIYIIGTKLDSTTSREWEQIKGNDDPITLSNLLSFLKNRADMLETLELNQTKRHVITKPTASSKSFVASQLSCAFCKQSHFIQNCAEFLKLPIPVRIDKVRNLKICHNCLRKGHFTKECKSGTCKKCEGPHNTLLHIPRRNELEPAAGPSNPNPTNEAQVNLHANTSVHVLLSTVSVQILDKNGVAHTARALLDVGSQSSFITTSLCEKLKLPLSETNMTISGLNHMLSQINSKCQVQLQAEHNNFKIDVSCLVIREITGFMPNFELNVHHLKIPKNLKLADPNFAKPSSIDILIGADYFWRLLCIGQIDQGPNHPILQKTRFGWVISGLYRAPQSTTSTLHCNFSQTIDDSNILLKFWEIEECSNQKPQSLEEKACEAHFVSHTKRDEMGRFIVTIPLKGDVSNLGNSQSLAGRRFHALEKKLQVNDLLRSRYISFMREYISLNHMSLTNSSQVSNINYYLPHHGVIKEESLTTKLRVVFNGSAPSTTGVSVNDLQMIGPTIQPELISILLRFRQHTYVLSADVEKMYRQVLVDPKQRCLQRILWREDPLNELKSYDLNTITYGTAAASFLAIRCLTQLGIECASEYPTISQIIQQDFYVDDLLTGTNSPETFKHICMTLPTVLTRGCFKLRKWISNVPSMLTNIDEKDKHEGLMSVGSSDTTNTLGLTWSFQNDHLLYVISDPPNSKVTKRVILSQTSQIFDPLGLLSPCVIIAKILLQKLWLEKLSWDESLPNFLQTEWELFRNQLPQLNNLRISRHVLCPNPTTIELHGFSDSSELAYGCCIYLRSVDENGHISSHLLCSKSKVAPLKSLTIPKLELCAALLLSRLFSVVVNSLTISISASYLWTDSTIVLGWIKTPPNLLKLFVGNRVAELQDTTKHATWGHVSSKDNPADLVSRGLSPCQLIESKLWWHGPLWLSESSSHWPISKTSPPTLPEMKAKCHALLCSEHSKIWHPIFLAYSKLTKLQRVVAYCLRFKSNSHLPQSERYFGCLTTSELNQSMTCLIKLSQLECFPIEISQLQTKHSVPTTSRLASLNPFLDTDGVIRVGGRLQNSTYSYNKVHPVIISGKHPISKLIFEREHIALLHAGPQLLLGSIREKFWTVSGRSVAKQVVHKCVICFRAKPRFISPIMGKLPESRITPSFPFDVTGVDYAGPILIKDRKGRGCKHVKCYICLFICFSSKAIHLELVTDLTSQSFILSLRRFIARRGKPSKLFSDNGTNFVGANSELQELGKFLIAQQKTLSASLAQEGIQWQFIPSHSPHFAGLWEAGVKSSKFHLKRVAGRAFLTFEEMYTLLAQVEATLNSRPLYPISADPNDLCPLTPGHFLVGRTLTTAPDPDVSHIPESRLTNFQRIQQLHQHYWQRWQKEYLAELQQRTKWKTSQGDLQLGALVLLKDDNAPPLKWRLGRIVDLHPGKDGVNRVASIRTSTGVVRRAFQTFCPLPVE